jgi:citrate lyase beta subunit
MPTQPTHQPTDQPSHQTTDQTTDHQARGTGVDVAALADALDERLRDADRELARRFPGPRAGRQPVHTVYVPADRYDAGLTAAWGAAATAAVDLHHDAFARIVGDDALEEAVRRKLASEPVEDLRIDFEDGYGTRPDAEEDAAVDRAARELRSSMEQGTAPPFTGIRFKSFESPTRRRGLRTLARFLEQLCQDGSLPTGFVVTLPKVTSVDQVEAMVLAAQRIEAGVGLMTPLGFEIQVETPQSILGPDGTALVARMVHAAAGRCTGLHYGTYDYSASIGIAAEFQAMDHPAADHAKAVMQVAAAETGVRVSDGSTNVIPVGGPESVAAAWALHHRLVGRSLARGYYQGWDLHPAQLPTRYAAVFSFYRKGFDAASTRLHDYVAQRESAFMDEPATARALADFVLRGLDCGALDDDDAVRRCGLDRAALARLARRA